MAIVEIFSGPDTENSEFIADIFRPSQNDHRLTLKKWCRKHKAEAFFLEKGNLHDHRLQLEKWSGNHKAEVFFS